MNPEEKRQLEELIQFKKNLESSRSIPLNIDQSFRARFINSLGALTVSAKGTDTEDVTVISSVNFGAQTVGTTVVMDDADAFLQITINGTVYYVPVFTS